MRNRKIRFVLPVCLCCLLVCGLAVGSRYAWGVTLMQRAMAASAAYQYAHVVPAGELAQALDGEASLSTGQIVAAAEQVRQGVDGDMSPYFAGDLSQRFTQNCASALEVPLEWAFSVDAGNTHGQLLSVEKESDTRARVRYRATSWLTTIYTYTSSPSTPWRSSATGIPPQLCWKTKTASGRSWSRTSKSRSSPQTATSPSKAGFPPIQRPWSL